MTVITRFFAATIAALCVTVVAAPVGSRAQGNGSSAEPDYAARPQRILPVRLSVRIKERTNARKPEYRGKIRVSDEYGENIISVPGENKRASTATNIIVNDGYPVSIKRKQKAPDRFNGAFTISGELMNRTVGVKAYTVGKWDVTYTEKEIRQNRGKQIVVVGDKADLLVTFGTN